MSRLVDITNEIKALSGLKEYRIINFMLGKAIERLPSMSVEKILTYTTAAHPIKEHLTIWPKYLEQVKQEFKVRNLDFYKLQLTLNNKTS